MKKILLSMALVASSAAAFAQAPAVTDASGPAPAVVAAKQKLTQDKATLRADRQQRHELHEKIHADKSAGNVAAVASDKDAMKSLKDKSIQDRKQMNADRNEMHMARKTARHERHEGNARHEHAEKVEAAAK